MKTFKFSLVLHTCENTDVFIPLDENINDIHSKRVNILYVHILTLKALITTTADRTLKYFLFFNFSEKIRLEISWESSAYMKH